MTGVLYYVSQVCLDQVPGGADVVEVGAGPPVRLSQGSALCHDGPDGRGARHPWRNGSGNLPHLFEGCRGGGSSALVSNGSEPRAYSMAGWS